MKLYRLALSRHINDLTGAGARMYGGRWNAKGTPVLYTSESRALAVLEYLVHVPLTLVPDGLALREFSVPDDVVMERLSAARLPAGWGSSPPSDVTVAQGEAWFQKGRALLLKVPSAVVPEEFNYLINPAHPGFGKITAGKAKPFAMDDRLLVR